MFQLIHSGLPISMHIVLAVEEELMEKKDRKVLMVVPDLQVELMVLTAAGRHPLK